jgi:hypothetical protein
MLPRIICLTTVCISAPQDTEYMVGRLLHLQDMKHAKSASSTLLLSEAVKVVSEQYASSNRQDCSSVRSIHAGALFIQASFSLVSSRATPTGPLSRLSVEVVGQCTEALPKHVCVGPAASLRLSDRSSITILHVRPQVCPENFASVNPPFFAR